MLKWRRKKETMAKIKNNFRLLLIFIMLILGLGLIKTHPVSAVSSIPVDLETGYIYNIPITMLPVMEEKIILQ